MRQNSKNDTTNTKTPMRWTSFRFYGSGGRATRLVELYPNLAGGKKIYKVIALVFAALGIFMIVGLVAVLVFHLN